MQLLRDNLTVRIACSLIKKSNDCTIIQLWTSDTQGDGDEQPDAGDN